MSKGMEESDTEAVAILGPLAEKNFVTPTYLYHSPLVFFSRPVSLGFVILAGVAFSVPTVRMSLAGRRREAAAYTAADETIRA